MREFVLGPSLLFCPADRPERFAKAMERADAVILDLEDAVLPDARRAARGHLIDADIDADRVVVRVNPIGTADFEADLLALAQTDFRTVMVAKAESAKRMRALDERFSVIALCETARGIQAADRIAARDNVVGLMWGAEDLIASLGGTSSRFPDGTYRDVARHARSRVLLAAGARDKAAIDSVYVDIDDVEGLRTEAADAAASGFRAKACIHPGQVAAIREAYRPSAAEIEWAQAVLAAAETEHGVFRFRGAMVDEPVLRHARSVRSRAEL